MPQNNQKSLPKVTRDLLFDPQGLEQVHANHVRSSSHSRQRNSIVPGATHLDAVRFLLISNKANCQPRNMKA